MFCVLSNTEVPSHIKNVLSAIEELSWLGVGRCFFVFSVFNFIYLNSHMWLVATLAYSIVLE